MSKKQYVFGYGSLVSREDIFRTLGRQVEFIYPATLNGWIRDWSVVIDNTTSHRQFALGGGKGVANYVAALNVRRPATDEPSTNPNGILFEVSEADLRKLDKRESHYRRVDITTDVVNRPTGTVYTYTGLDQFLDVHNEAVKAVIPESYLELVTQGFASLGPDMRGEYLRTTQPSSLPVVGSVFKKA